MSSKDTRTQREKLEDMARLGTPHERENAQHILFKRYGTKKSGSVDEDGTLNLSSAGQKVDVPANETWWQRFGREEREEQARSHPYVVSPFSPDDMSECLVCGQPSGAAVHRGQGIQYGEENMSKHDFDEAVAFANHYKRKNASS